MVKTSTHLSLRADEIEQAFQKLPWIVERERGLKQDYIDESMHRTANLGVVNANKDTSDDELVGVRGKLECGAITFILNALKVIRASRLSSHKRTVRMTESWFFSTYDLSSARVLLSQMMYGLSALDVRLFSA